jgi:E3 ubiquitin-protein ligase HUWE1
MRNDGFKVVERLSKEERALLLKFATGSARVPLGGFEHLKGLTDAQKFTVRLWTGDKTSLPRASTCFNCLYLPAYGSYEILEAKLLSAIRYGCQGFQFG